MKLLSTEQQTDLRNLLEEFQKHQVPIGLANQLNFWCIELKPKRTRKKKEDTEHDHLAQTIQEVYG